MAVEKMDLEKKTQGDHVTFRSKDELDKKLPFILKRMECWDYSTPMVVRLENYQSPRTLSQNAMSHIWFREIAEGMAKKGHAVDHEDPEFVWKLYLKKRFLGVHTFNNLPDQIKSTSKLTKGEFVHFLDNVYHWAIERGIRLSIPAESEYAELQAQQEA